MNKMGKMGFSLAFTLVLTLYTQNRMTEKKNAKGQANTLHIQTLYKPKIGLVHLSGPLHQSHFAKYFLGTHYVHNGQTPANVRYTLDFGLWILLLTNLHQLFSSKLNCNFFFFKSSSTLSCMILKITKHTLKILLCSQRKIFKVCLTIFHHDT